MRRSGFTLTEMLVATIVFLVGFVAVFGLFLAGMRFRKLSEDTTRASLAASCIIDEIRLDAGGGMTNAPKKPSEYVGDGFADKVPAGANPEGSSDSSAPDDPLFAYRSVPGVWYRVMKSTDLNGIDTNERTTVLHLKLLVVPFSTSDTELTFATLNRRLGLVRDQQTGQLDPNASPTAVGDALVQRGIGFSYQVVITRRPSWMP